MANKPNFDIDMKKKKKLSANVISLIVGAAVIIISALLFFNKILDVKLFSFISGIAIVIAGLPFFISLLVESKREADIEHMFLEFSRDLVEGVKSGTPISKSIINVQNKDYGDMNPYVEKLANQIALGIPVKDALDTFARSIKSEVISRAVSLIREAEVSGGRIESILESVTFSISQIEKLKKERKAAIYNLTVQGYIIFFIFILIMLVMQFKIIPIVSGLNLGGTEGISNNPLTGVVPGGITAKINAEDLALPFLLLLLAQGFFAGLVIGKISEGSVKGGLKHSFILVAVSWLISTGAKLILG